MDGHGDASDSEFTPDRLNLIFADQAPPVAASSYIASSFVDDDHHQRFESVEDPAWRMPNREFDQFEKENLQPTSPDMRTSPEAAGDEPAAAAAGLHTTSQNHQNGDNNEGGGHPVVNTNITRMTSDDSPRMAGPTTTDYPAAERVDVGPSTDDLENAVPRGTPVPQTPSPLWAQFPPCDVVLALHAVTPVSFRRPESNFDDHLNDHAMNIQSGTPAVGGAGSASALNKIKEKTTRKRKRGVADDVVNMNVNTNAAACRSASTAVKEKKQGTKGRKGRKRIYGETSTPPAAKVDNKGTGNQVDFPLKDFVWIEDGDTRRPGWLPKDWRMMGRPGKDGRVDMYYYQPGGRIYKSASKVEELLGLKPQKKSRSKKSTVAPAAAAAAVADGAGAKVCYNTAAAAKGSPSSSLHDNMYPDNPVPAAVFARQMAMLDKFTNVNSLAAPSSTSTADPLKKKKPFTMKRRTFYEISPVDGPPEDQIRDNAWYFREDGVGKLAFRTAKQAKMYVEQHQAAMAAAGGSGVASTSVEAARGGSGASTSVAAGGGTGTNTCTALSTMVLAPTAEWISSCAGASRGNGGQTSEGPSKKPRKSKKPEARSQKPKEMTKTRKLHE